MMVRTGRVAVVRLKDRRRKKMILGINPAKGSRFRELTGGASQKCMILPVSSSTYWRTFFKVFKLQESHATYTLSYTTRISLGLLVSDRIAELIDYLGFLRTQNTQK